MLIDLWVAALNSKLGICIIVDDRVLLRQHLYKARVEANNPRLEEIVMILPEKEDEIWLVHKDADGPRTDNEGYPKLVHS